MQISVINNYMLHLDIHTLYVESEQSYIVSCAQGVTGGTEHSVRKP